ncbi:MAG: IPT/TIG domain-containing protein [Treponema sp.]|nr:IPT/TIG domain-containing protein [Treponema sp.]
MVVIFVVSSKNKPEPVIESIVPSVGSPGDVIVINGTNFGDTRDMSYVEFAGSKLTSSSYLSWSDNCIKLVLPSNVQDGLVIVGTKDLRSAPALFANEVDIPVPVPENQQSTRPIVSSLSSDRVLVGDVLTIYGNNFGDSRGHSKVLFTVNYNKKISETALMNRNALTENMISASDFDGDYVLWSNTEIKVRVPDGANSGVVMVDTVKDKSEPKNITVLRNVGEKHYVAKKIYLVEYSADVAGIVFTDVPTITLRCPIPVEAVSQPAVEVTDFSQTPAIQNYQNCFIYQITKYKNLEKSLFKQTFVAPVYEINTRIYPDKIGSYKTMNQLKFEEYTKDDELVPCGDERVVALSKKIIGKEKNPYNKAKLIYNYLIDNYKLLDTVQKDEDSVLDMLETKMGDAYDFSVIYAALLRSCGIPCVVDAGILIQQNLLTQAHWWCEFYLPGFGWVPVDVALGGGLDYKKWNDIGNERNYYFGNLDSHRIVFSRGWSQFKPFTQENKIVQYPKSFALQSIWEEYSSSTVKYSSYWSLPVIKGVY